MAHKVSHPSLAGPEAEPKAISKRDGTAATCESGMPDSELHLREALVLWLRWNEAYEQATAHMFAAGQSADKLEAFMDKMDRLRREAISLSHELLD